MKKKMDKKNPFKDIVGSGKAKNTDAIPQEKADTGGTKKGKAKFGKMGAKGKGKPAKAAKLKFKK